MFFRIPDICTDGLVFFPKFARKTDTHRSFSEPCYTGFYWKRYKNFSNNFIWTPECTADLSVDVLVISNEVIQNSGTRLIK